MLPPSFVDGTSPPDVAVAYMDRHGVERAILVQELIEGFMNEVVADAVSQFPDRFVGEAFLDPTRKKSTDELEALLSSGKLSGLKLPISSLQRLDPDFGLDSAVALEWLSICERHSAFVTIHPPEPGLFADPMRRATERFPSVRFLIAHMGLPNCAGWEQVLDVCRAGNVFMEISATPYLFDEQYPCPRSQAALQTACHELGADKLLWGSDYPRTLTRLTYEQQIGWVRDECAFLSEADKAKVLGLNALRVVWEET